MTLIEVLVAMAIIAVALVALMRIHNQALLIQPRLETQFMANLLAENRLVEYAIAPPQLRLTKDSGEAKMGNHLFVWEGRVEETTQTGLFRVDIEVQRQSESQDSERSYALTGFFSHVTP